MYGISASSMRVSVLRVLLKQKNSLLTGTSLCYVSNILLLLCSERVHMYCGLSHFKMNFFREAFGTIVFSKAVNLWQESQDSLGDLPCRLPALLQMENAIKMTFNQTRRCVVRKTETIHFSDARISPLFVERIGTHNNSHTR